MPFKLRLPAALEERLRARLERWTMRHYQLPYPPGHFYMPVANFQNIVNRDIDRLPAVDPDSFLDDALVGVTLQAIGETAAEQGELPDYFDPRINTLGLGFGEVEGHVAYSVVRHVKPSVVLEFGAGVSTFYFNEALKRNGSGRMVAVEPYPSANLVTFCTAEGIDLKNWSAQDFKLEDAGPLDGRVVVSIDTTHVLRADSELPNLLLRIIPALPKGSLIHFHDIYWPYATLFREHEMSRYAAVWNESLALMLLLQGNRDLEILLPMYHLIREGDERFGAAVPRYLKTRQVGSSLWLRRV
ncbi:hypothetical protein ASD79_00965 [Caulobacter sp. Root655]|uniref:class I SAM-dependent methyltransferase n=1 Tax=Caulobacter sp. Root655 TaxID=1736578 RepID=UPI0006F3241B|nr:class I SAM-dependent methyltransferase [Caulobacter sp. Root655]KRA65886.1 hypothetical protein ASD79_00965 [Caulobacter sp. Root655]